MSFNYHPLFFIAFVAWFAPLIAQPQTRDVIDPDVLYHEGVVQFEQGYFATAKELFKEYNASLPPVYSSHQKEMRNRSLYYLGVSSLELGQSEAKNFLLEYAYAEPENSLTQKAYYQIGRVYFNEKQYGEALEWFDKTDKFNLSVEERQAFTFQKAYCHFFRKELDKAYPLFREIKDVQNKYYYPANYYFGFLSYERKEYDDALQSFEKLSDSKLYASIVPYYIANIYFYQKNYDKVITYLSPLLTSPDVKNFNELEFLLGKAFYEKARFADAIPYFETYLKQNSGKVTETDRYMIGRTFALSNRCQEAIVYLKQFTKAIDLFTQTALYQLGACYLSIGSKPEARNVFFETSLVDFDKEIRKHSLLFYGKLSYELNYDKEAIDVFKIYLEQYPGDDDAEEVQTLISEILVNTRNYDEAINLIESIKQPAMRIKTAYQLITLSKAIELINEGEYFSASSYLNKSLLYPNDQSLRAHALYWQGEVACRNDHFDEALIFYDQSLRVLSLNPSAENTWYEVNANYGAGYASYALKRYTLAKSYFDNSVNRAKGNIDPDLGKKIYPDAVLRSADCAFILKSYDEAVNGYHMVLNEKLIGADYAVYQLAIVKGLNGLLPDKINLLKRLRQDYQGSPYADDALFETAVTQVSMGKIAEGKEAFKQVISTFPGSSYTPKSMVRLGLIYYNENDNKNALSYFNSVIEKYPKTEVARQALLGIKDISVDENNPSLYVDAAAKSGINTSVTEKDSITYMAAEAQYLKQNCNDAIAAFSKYLSLFPQGLFTLQATYYRGECYYDGHQLENAVIDYRSVADLGQSKFYERSLIKAANLLYKESKDYNSALYYYRKLADNYSNRENLFAARLGMMRCYFKLDDITNLAEQAQFVYDDRSATKEQTTEAGFYLAKVALSKGNYDQANQLYKKMVASTTTVLAAESLYDIAYILFFQKKYEDCLDACLEINSLKPGYEYWIVKGFLLMADAYIALDNSFQAEATLKSVVENTNIDELRIEAEEKLSELRWQQAGNKANESNQFEEDSTDILQLINPGEENEE